jgi:phage gp36-like protein
LQAAVQSAREAEACVAVDAQQAEAALERATAELDAITEAYDRPLTHARARQTAAWSGYVARFWADIIADPGADGITSEHRDAAYMALRRVLRAPVARKVALDVAARGMAEERRTRPQLERTDDGNFRVTDYSSVARPLKPTWFGRLRTRGPPPHCSARTVTTHARRAQRAYSGG